MGLLTSIILAKQELGGFDGLKRGASLAELTSAKISQPQEIIPKRNHK